MNGGGRSGRHPLPPGRGVLSEPALKYFLRYRFVTLFPPGWKPRLYGRQDARRYNIWSALAS